MDNRLQNLETRPSPRRIAANAIGASQLQEESVVEGSIAPGIVDGTLIAGGSVGSAQIQDLIITENKIFDGAISTIKIAANAITEAQLAANSVTSAIIAANAVVNSKLAADAVTSINILANSIIGTKIAANAVDSLQIAADAVGSIELSSNAVTYGKVSANAIVGNNIQAGSVTGDRITANSLYGNTIVANTLYGNSIVANTLSGNTIVANTLHGNSVVANTINGNTVIANTISGNTIIANTLSGNTILANTLSGNTVIANTISGNTIVANSLQGNTIVANTLFGNSIVAGSLTGDRITGTTSIRLADSLLASPTNFIQFGYVTPAGQASAVPGIYGYYGGYPNFYIGGWDRPVDGYADAGVSFGVYDYHTSTPVSMMNIYYENFFSAGTQQVLFTTGGFGVFVDGYDTVDPVIGDITLSTDGGTGSVRVALNQTPDIYGTYPALVTDGPIRLSMSPITLSLTSDNHGITVGVNQTGIPNQYSIAISDRAIQARLAQGASKLELNALGGDIELGGQLRIKAGFTDVSLTSTTHPFQIGDTSGVNLRIDNNEIQGVSNGSAEPIFLNNEGGVVTIGPSGGTADILTVRGGLTNLRAYARTVTGRALQVNTSGDFGTTVSSRRFKREIAPIEYDYNKILSIVPVTFKYNPGVLGEREDQDAVQLGFIAEDLHEAGLEHIVELDENGIPLRINYEMYVTALQVAIRHQADLLTTQAESIAQLNTRVTQLGG
jgi:hypothetical protein